MSGIMNKILAKYHGFSDFFHRATLEDKIAVFTEVAKKANEEQRRVVECKEHIDK